MAMAERASASALRNVETTLNKMFRRLRQNAAISIGPLTATAGSDD
jgi:hypothetical protein